MSGFNKEHFDDFLGIVRKYMQLRGNLSQKELSDLTGVGVSTISRFLNQKTQVLDEQIIARVVAKLNIPIFEILDFIQENYQVKFQRLVKFYKDSEQPEKIGVEDDTSIKNINPEPMNGKQGTATLTTEAKVRIGNGPTRTIPFGSQNDNSQSRRNNDLSIGEKLQTLTPKQKVYMQSFLDLDSEGRDLVVDIGNSLFTYFRQKGLDF